MREYKYNKYKYYYIIDFQTIMSNTTKYQQAFQGDFPTFPCLSLV